MMTTPGDVPWFQRRRRKASPALATRRVLMLCSETGREVMVRKVTQAMMGCPSLGGREGRREV
jgi:hypothetical protein